MLNFSLVFLSAFNLHAVGSDFRSPFGVILLKKHFTANKFKNVLGLQKAQKLVNFELFSLHRLKFQIPTAWGLIYFRAQNLKCITTQKLAKSAFGAPRFPEQRRRHPFQRCSVSLQKKTDCRKNKKIEVCQMFQKILSCRKISSLNISKIFSKKGTKQAILYS